VAKADAVELWCIEWRGKFGQRFRVFDDWDDARSWMIFLRQRSKEYDCWML
jgi:hypothetical protein